jgi:hypothetical protein
MRAGFDWRQGWISSGAVTSGEASAGIDRWTNGGDQRIAEA